MLRHPKPDLEKTDSATPRLECFFSRHDERSNGVAAMSSGSSVEEPRQPATFWLKRAIPMVARRTTAC